MPPSGSAGSRAKEAESQKKLSVSLEHMEGSSAGVELRGAPGGFPWGNGDMKVLSMNGDVTIAHSRAEE